MGFDREKIDDVHKVSAQLRGETMAYAVQSGLYNIAGNFFEPYINYRFQKHYSNAEIGQGRHGSYAQNLGGELAGDIIGAGTLMAAELLIPNQLHSFTRAARRAIDPLYHTVAKVVFSSELGKPGCDKKIDQWKTFQERNMVRSAIIATAGIAGNIATQKWVIKNPAPSSIIFKGKLLSSAITTGLGLGVRMAFPENMRNLDEWMGERLAPMMGDAEGNELVTSHSARIDQQRQTPQQPSR